MTPFGGIEAHYDPEADPPAWTIRYFARGRYRSGWVRAVVEHGTARLIRADLEIGRPKGRDPSMLEL